MSRTPSAGGSIEAMKLWPISRRPRASPASARLIASRGISTATTTDHHYHKPNRRNAQMEILERIKVFGLSQANLAVKQERLAEAKRREAAQLSRMYLDEGLLATERGQLENEAAEADRAALVLRRRA